MAVTNFRLIAVDLDGCLLDSAGKVPEASRIELDILACQGIRWCVVTGRSLGTLTGLQQQLYPTGGWIWSHGAQARSDYWTRSATLAKLDVLAIADLLREDFPGSVMAVDCEEVLYRDEGYPVPTWPPGRRHTVADRDMMALLGGDMIRIRCDRVGDLVVAIEEMALPVRAWETGRAGYVEITASAASKLSALGMLATYLGARGEEIAVIGDGHSDAGMLAWAGLGVSFADAHPSATGAADVVLGERSGPEVNRFVEAIGLVVDEG